MTFEEMVAAARARITELTPQEVEDRLSTGSSLLIDVRESHEVAAGSIERSIHIPRASIERDIADHARDRAQEILLVCAVGERSALAAAALKDAGYRNVASMAGGLERWRDEGRPWIGATLLDSEQRKRYSRHLVLRDVGEAGQARLLSSRVLVVGAGGLSSPVALYLAAAGVGTIGIVDFDAVEVSNLQRQIIHRTDSVGRPKATSAAETLASVNPEVKVETYQTRLSAGNALDIVGGYDVIVDGADNFPTRYLINDASLHTRTPVVHGSIYAFEGQTTVFLPYESPCYRCLFREPPPPELAPSCAEAGVLGVLPGVIGSIQATETIKLLLDIGSGLAGRLLTYDALEQSFRPLRVERDPGCPACSDPTAPPPLVDYDETCVPPGSAPNTNN